MIYDIVKHMRKYLVSFIFGILLCCVAVTPVLADSSEGISRGLPGQNCGVASAEEGSDLRQCCYIAPEKLPGVKLAKLAATIDKVTSPLSWIPGVPKIPFLTTGILGDTAQSYIDMNDNMMKFQADYGAKTPCIDGEPSNPDDLKTPGACTCEPSKESSTISKMCESYFRADTRTDAQGKPTDESKRTATEAIECQRCADDFHGYYSSLGCIPFELSGMINWFVSFSVIVGGMIALFCLVLNSLRLQLSKGDPKGIQAARQQITSCLMGLMLILFAVLIMRIVGLTLFAGLNLG